MKIPDLSGGVNFLTGFLSGLASFLTKIIGNPVLLILIIVVVGGIYVYLRFFRQRQ